MNKFTVDANFENVKQIDFKNDWFLNFNNRVSMCLNFTGCKVSLFDLLDIIRNNQEQVKNLEIFIEELYFDESEYSANIPEGKALDIYENGNWK